MRKSFLKKVNVNRQTETLFKAEIITTKNKEKCYKFMNIKMHIWTVVFINACLVKNRQGGMYEFLKRFFLFKSKRM